LLPGAVAFSPSRSAINDHELIEQDQRNLRRAIEAGDKYGVARAMAGGAVVTANMRLMLGRRVIRAAEAGDGDFVQRAVSTGVEINRRCTAAALRIAAEKGHVGILRSLLEAGSLAEGREGTSHLLWIAACHDRVAACRMLLQLGAEPSLALAGNEGAAQYGVAKALLDTVQLTRKLYSLYARTGTIGFLAPVTDATLVRVSTLLR
jgi:hypothetical protein